MADWANIELRFDANGRIVDMRRRPKSPDARPSRPFPTIVINSYHPRALERLLDSLARCEGFENAEIVVVKVGASSGGHIVETREPVIVGNPHNVFDWTALMAARVTGVDRAGGADRAGSRGNVVTVRSPHNAFDWTGLMALLEVPDLRRDWYFYLHDTCTVGKDFLRKTGEVMRFVRDSGDLATKKLVQDPTDEPIDHDVKTTASFYFHSMNIGLYSRSALEAHAGLVREFVDRARGADVQTIKKLAVETEDHVFRANSRNHTFLGAQDPTYEPISDVYGEGIPRMTLYFPCVDLFKHKANWEGKDTYELGL